MIITNNLVNICHQYAVAKKIFFSCDEVIWDRLSWQLFSMYYFFNWSINLATLNYVIQYGLTVVCCMWRSPNCFITGNLDLWTFSLFCPYLSFEDPFSFIAVALFIILYKLHVCTITFQLLYTQPHAHHQKFSFYWSPFSWSLSSFFPPPPLHTPSPLVTTTLISASMNYVLSWSFINLFI